MTRAGPIIVAVIAALLSSPLSAREYRSREVTREFQREHPCPSTGQTSGACPGYRKDHVIPLACGGPDAISNLNGRQSPRREPRTNGSGGLAFDKKLASGA
jgi:hypothetical protein